MLTAAIIGVIIAILGWKMFKMGIYTILVALNEMVKSVDKTVKK